MVDKTNHDKSTRIQLLIRYSVVRMSDKPYCLSDMDLTLSILKSANFNVSCQKIYVAIYDIMH